ncbi:MAG: paraquat-inducible protein A [Acidocella sp.]|nr:paraquat-inducible protein A [Acidocella sp.]
MQPGGGAADETIETPPVRANWRECRQCGLVSTLPRMRPELVADCPRCANTLWRMRRHPFELPIACGLSALLFYIYALVAPFLEISAYGRFQLARIETGPVELGLQGFTLVGLLVLAVTVIFPGLKLGIVLVTLFGIKSRVVPARVLKAIFRWHGPIGPWAMVDVYLLGFLVAYTRLAAIASVHLDTALYALIGLMIMMAATDAALDTEAVWRALDAADDPCDETPVTMTSAVIGCPTCGLVNRGADGDGCRRCGTRLRPRKTESVARAWAFVVAAMLLYIPANIYPVLLITQLGASHGYTIMGGIFELADYGLWPLAMLVFLASITIPLMKLLILGYVLITTQTRSAETLLARTRAFRLIDFIGRWSMIDVFMISILVALVRFGQVSNIHAETGAPCFAAVVVLTMFAVSSFDPRLMWDALQPDDMNVNTQEAAGI